MLDETNDATDIDNPSINFMPSYKPWTLVVRGRSTCTSNIYHTQKELLDNNQPPITREHVAEALHNRNLLRQTKVIQISSNIKYLSIQFNTSQLMETFYTEPLKICDFSATFLPDFKKRPRRQIQYTYISFLNIPSDAEEETLTEYVEQHTTVVGQPRYPTKNWGTLNT